MTELRPTLVVAAPHSGAGKTSIALGLVAALRRRGLDVQTFKVGPDYLDPTYLARASGHACYNLDGWMMGEAYVRALFAKASTNADICIIEGVMGLFDGAEPTGMAGSTAEIAAWLGAPVLLVVDAHGAARSIAATVEGFARFEPTVALAAVVANRVGSASHGNVLSAALASRDLPPLVGAVAQGALPTLGSRHLGLISADEQSLAKATLEELGTVVERSLDLSRLIALAHGCDGGHSAYAVPSPLDIAAPLAVPPRIGIAYDEAFHFYYQDNLDALEQHGCSLVRFSPLHDPHLPPELSAMYLGGGYPEIHGPSLAANRTMLDDIRRFAGVGRPLYAECGGLMYLSKGIEMLDGTRHPLVGLLPSWTRMCPKRRALGYAEVELTRDSLWGTTGTRLRGHEFRYSELVTNPTEDPCWQNVYQVRGRRNEGDIRHEGFQRGPLLASYVHLHLASRPEAIRRFVQACPSSAEGAEPCPPNP